MNKKLRKAISTTLRAVIGVGLAAVIIWKLVEHNEVDFVASLTDSAPAWLILAFLIYGSVLVLTTFRWRYLLYVQDLHLPPWELFKLTMIGTFFNLAIPGAVGGDVLKMVYISQHAKERTTEAVLTIMIDRVLGLLGLFAVALVALALSIPFLKEASSQIQLVTIGVAVCSVGGFSSIFVIYFRQTLMKLPGIRSLVKFGADHLPDKVTGIIIRLVSALDLYKTQPKLLLKAFSLSILIHALLGLTIYLVALCYKEYGVAVNHHFLAMQIANTAASIPVIPGGLGARDAVLIEFLKAAGAVKEKAGVIALTYSILMILWSLIGGIFFVFTKYKKESDIQPDSDLEIADESVETAG